jgi:hypothetical protein
MPPGATCLASRGAARRRLSSRATPSFHLLAPPPPSHPRPQGLARLQPFFQADRTKGGAELEAAQQAAKQAKLKVSGGGGDKAAPGGSVSSARNPRPPPCLPPHCPLPRHLHTTRLLTLHPIPTPPPCPQIWENWTPEDDKPADADEAGADEAGASGSSGGGEVLNVTVTEVANGNEIYLQVGGVGGWVGGWVAGLRGLEMGRWWGRMLAQQARARAARGTACRPAQPSRPRGPTRAAAPPPPAPHTPGHR